MAPISGSIESSDANPLATALREIKEETSLPPSALELLRVGKPYSFIDEDLGREWTINPFAFRLKDKSEHGGVGEEGIAIDWEHEGVEWYDPLAVKGTAEFGGVPRLVYSLRRVWPAFELGVEAGEALTATLQSMRDDRESGARELAKMAILTLKEVISKMDESAFNEAGWRNIRMAAWHLCKNGRESMSAAITSALLSVLSRIEGIATSRPLSSNTVPSILKAIDEELTQREHLMACVKQNLSQYLRETLDNQIQSKGRASILTLSSSSTISSTLLDAARSLDAPLDLRILESRPNCEGVSLASKFLQSALAKGWADQNLRITLYTDASAAVAAADDGAGVGVILLGADRVNANGDVSNKTGSLPAVLSARHASPGVKVAVLSDTEKVAGPGAPEEHVVEDNDPRELTSAWDHLGLQEAGKLLTSQDFVRVRNVYFEWVPANLIDTYITELGCWSTDEIIHKSNSVNEASDRFFKYL